MIALGAAIDRVHDADPGAEMLSFLPFLMSANDAGIICLVIFLASSVIFGIPVFANRGTTQLIWAGVVGFALTVEIALMITFVALVSSGNISPSF